jgi:Domain of unknown function (DUF4157)
VKTHATRVATAVPATSALVLRRSCACEGGEETDCEDCRKSAVLRRRAFGGCPSGGVPSIVHSVLHTSGEPLDAATRSVMEARFGHDFSRIRVHADASGAASARAVAAHAYTVGEHVVFGEGRYAPRTGAGEKLLAHELTHAVQEAGRRPGRSGSLELGASDAREEAEADAVAEGRRAPSSIGPSSGPLAVRRQAKEAACAEDFLGKIDPIAERAATFLSRAVSALKSVRRDQDNEATRLLDEHFHVSGDMLASYLPDIVTRMEAIAQTVRDWRSLTIRCLDRGASCQNLFPARYARDDAGERLVFCSDFPDYVPAYQVETFLHEMGHAAFEEVIDHAYAHQRSYAFLKPAEAYRNADSYARFAIDLSRGLFKKGEGQEKLKGAPVDDVAGCSGKGAVSAADLRAALARAERMNEIAAQTFDVPALLQERAARLVPFGLFRREQGRLVPNERLRQQYYKTYIDARKILGKKLRVICRPRANDDYKHYPVELSADTLTIRESWKWSVQWFGWEKEILSMVYGRVTNRDPYLGDPRDPFRPGTAAILAHWIETDVMAERLQTVEQLEAARKFQREQEPSLRKVGNARPRKTVSKGARGCPVPELQEKLQAGSSPQLQVTGLFDDDTQQAVAEFQIGRGLVMGGGERKGVAGPKTWAALLEAVPGEHGLPTGETFEADGWGDGESAPIVRWKQVLQPTTIDFRGCHVMERTVQAPDVRGCKAGPLRVGALSGGVWEVKAGNTYGPDNVGQTAAVVTSIRRNPVEVPCLYSIPQAMVLLREDAEVRKQKPEAIEKRVEAGMKAEHAEYVRNWLTWAVTANEILAVKWNEKFVMGANRKFP